MSKHHVVAILLAVLCASCASAQTQLAASITDVEIEPTGNGVEITLKADGLLQVMAFDQWVTNEDHEFELVLPNARSSIGTFVDVSTYPVNYLKLEIPSQERVEELVRQAGGGGQDLEEWRRVVQEGIGLILTVRLYRWGHVHTVELDNVDWDGEWDWDPGEIAYDIRKSRSGRELEITVWSDRRERLPKDVKPRAEQDLESSLDLQVEEGLVTVDAVNVPLQELMSTVGERSGEDIYVDDRVRRLVTCRLEEVSVERLIDAVSTGLGLTSTRADGAWYISDGLPTSLAPYTAGASRTITLDYLTAGTAIDLLPDFLLRYLRPSPSGESIVAYGPAQLLDRIEEDIKRLDRPPLAIRLQTAVVEIIRSRSSERVWHILRGGSSTVEVDGGEGSIRFRHGEESLDDLIARVRALDVRGEVRIDVRPSLIVEPGHAAQLFIGEQQYYRYIRRADDFYLSSAEAGTRLYVEPRASGGEYIESYVSVDVATFRGRRRPPIVDRRSALATLLMRNGGTMIIGGGLNIAESSDENSGPKPFRDVWPLRNMTERSADSESQREIIFLVSAETIENHHARDTSSDSPRGDA